MSTELPPLPETDWLLHMPARPYEPEWTSNQEGYDGEQLRAYAEAYARAAIAAEREACALIAEDMDYSPDLAISAAIRARATMETHASST